MAPLVSRCEAGLRPDGVQPSWGPSWELRVRAEAPHLERDGQQVVGHCRAVQRADVVQAGRARQGQHVRPRLPLFNGHAGVRRGLCQQQRPPARGVLLMRPPCSIASAHPMRARAPCPQYPAARLPAPHAANPSRACLLQLKAQRPEAISA